MLLLIFETSVISLETIYSQYDDIVKALSVEKRRKTRKL